MTGGAPLPLQPYSHFTDLFHDPKELYELTTQKSKRGREGKRAFPVIERHVSTS
jgi:hypothetical protein